MQGLSWGCRECSEGAVEDAEHFLLGCRSRTALIAEFRSEVGTPGETDAALFKRVMSPAFGYDEKDIRGSTAAAKSLYRHIRASEAARGAGARQAATRLRR